MFLDLADFPRAQAGSKDKPLFSLTSPKTWTQSKGMRNLLLVAMNPNVQRARQLLYFYRVLLHPYITETVALINLLYRHFRFKFIQIEMDTQSPLDPAPALSLLVTSDLPPERRSSLSRLLQ